jgi:amino acid transporter
LFYAFMVWVIIEANADPAQMYFAAMDCYIGGWARTLMEVLILTSILANLFAFHNAITRYAYSLAREGILPAAVGQPHARHLSPYRASAIQNLLAAVVVIVFAALRLDPMTQL